MKDKRNKISIIISIIVLVILLGSLTFAFFTADISNSEALNVIANFTEVNVIFTAVPSNDLELYIDADDMLKTNANTFKSSFETIEVSLFSINSAASCQFNLTWTDTGTTHYIPTPEAITKNLAEYTIKITDDQNNTILSETKVNNLTSGNQLLNVPLSISSAANTETFQTYTVTATIYNLDLAQTIYNQNYSSVVRVTNIVC